MSNRPLIGAFPEEEESLKPMSRYKSLMTACCATALAFGLAACSSGSDKTLVKTVPGPTPMVVDLAGLNTTDGSYTKPTAGPLMIDAGGSADSGDLAYSCAAGGEACEVTVDPNGNALATGGAVTAAHNAAYQTRLDTAETAATSANNAATAADEEAGKAEAAAEAARTAASAATAEGATAEATAATNAATEAENKAMAARSAATAARNAAAAAAMDASKAADADTAATAANTAAGEATTATTAANTAATTATTAANDAKEAEEQRLADLKAGTPEAQSMATAITAEAAQAGAGDGPGGTGVTAHTIAIARATADPATVTITVDGAAAEDPKFVKQDDGSYVRAMDADNDGNVVSEVMGVYSDIAAPTATAFGEVEALDARADGAAVDPTSSPADSKALGGSPIVANVAFDVARFTPDETDTTQRTYSDYEFRIPDDLDTEEDESRDAAMVAGTYRGVNGNYVCNNASDTNCSVTFSRATGAVTAMSADWIFTPEAGATIDVVDTTYLYWGYWLKQTADKDGAVTINEVETFAGATNDASTNAYGTIASVTGVATYDGAAAGVYERKTGDMDGDTALAVSGAFTADASLSVVFADDTLPVNQQGTLTGTIDNFMLDGEAHASWSVALEDDNITQDADGNSLRDGTVSGTAKGGVENQDGSFAALFRGPNADAQPASITGEFNATFSDGSVAGAFGASKTDD